ncbi:hypothetical protein HBI07_006320 [Parastagonospora nodorum]|nr:hypothetical protein HBI07_006320 [Parastagonospora nodorum]
MCAKDDLIRQKSLLSTSMQTPNHVDTFSLDFAFSFANILSLIAFIISYRLFADELNIQQSLPDRATVVLIIILVDKTQLSLILGDIAAYTLLAKFIPTTKIRDPLLKKNAAKSRILLACADGRTRQCYLTICAILANYEEQVLLTSIKKNRYYTRCTRTEQFTQLQQERCLNKGHDDFVHLVNCFSTEQKAIIQQLIAVVSPLFILKAPFALHFIRAVCNLVTLAQYKSHNKDTLAYIQGALERMNVFKEEFRHALTHIIQDIRIYRALDSICTRANSKAHYITIVKQFYSMTNKKEYILQICLHNSQRTALLAANYATIVKQSQPFTTSIPEIQPYSTKLPLSEVAANIAISDFTHAAAVKRHNDPKHCDEEVLHLILTIIDYTYYDKDRKHIAYIRAFSEVLLFNNNRQIDNTTRILTFKFYDLSTIIRPVHLILRDLPNSTTCTTMSYYVNNYIN